MALTNRDLRLMERLARAQARKAGGADEGAVEEIKRIELDTAWGEERTRRHGVGRGAHRHHRGGRRSSSRHRRSAERTGCAQPSHSQADKHLAQLVAGVGLGQVGVHAGRQRLRGVFVERVGGQRHDRHAGQAERASRSRMRRVAV